MFSNIKAVGMYKPDSIPAMIIISSLMKPFNPGKPAVANAPITRRPVVMGILLPIPAKLSRFLSLVR